MPVLAIILLFGIILGSTFLKFIGKALNIMFFQKSDFQKTKKRPLPGCLQTVVRSGDAPKPPFPIKTGKKRKNPKFRIPSTIAIPESALGATSKTIWAMNQNQPLCPKLVG